MVMAADICDKACCANCQGSLGGPEGPLKAYEHKKYLSCETIIENIFIYFFFFKLLQTDERITGPPDVQAFDIEAAVWNSITATQSGGNCPVAYRKVFLCTSISLFSFSFPLFSRCLLFYLLHPIHPNGFFFFFLIRVRFLVR